MASLLEKIDSPSDIKSLSSVQLGELCREIRDYIIEVISANPGHLAASLGAVEIAVAIHYVFDTPHDKLIWDVGHNSGVKYSISMKINIRSGT